jgi:hypothetical protein
LVQGSKSKDIELHTKDNLGSNKGSQDRGNLNLTRDLNSNEGLNIFKEHKFNKEDFLSPFKNQKSTWLGNEI